ncbi:MAG: hypothetical protein L0154_25165 [Chloroflexi bacterium]|nr:hypothetical protein [Chloroflexota bacterium]
MNLPPYFTRVYFSACREVLGVMTLHDVLHRTGLEPYIQSPPHYLSVEDFATFNWGIDQLNPPFSQQIGQLVARDLFPDSTPSLKVLPKLLDPIAPISIIDHTIVFDLCPVCFDLPSSPQRATPFCTFWTGLLETLLNTQITETSCSYLGAESCRFEMAVPPS